MASKFTEESSEVTLICPYCKKQYVPDPDSYHSDWNPEQCKACGKKYYKCQVSSIDHQTKPDCELNGEKHLFKGTSGDRYLLCSICNKMIDTLSH